LGIRIKKLIDSGVLLQDDDLYQVVKMRLNEIPATKGVIFDGIPRRLGQAEFLLNFLKEQGRTNFTTLYVSLPKEESLTRLLKRAEIEKRADDTREKIEFRLEQYEKETVPVLDFLKSNTEFFEIDGKPTVGQVSDSINKALKLKENQSFAI
jgi:adenylate kinase